MLTMHAKDEGDLECKDFGNCDLSFGKFVPLLVGGPARKK